MPTASQIRREVRKRQAEFAKARVAEGRYGAQLRSVARQVGAIVRGFSHEGFEQDVTKMMAALHEYARLLAPWARSVAVRMIKDVSRRDETAWTRKARLMGESIGEEIRKTPVGETVRRSLEEQVDLITSLPRKAAERVHHLTVKGLSEGTRPEEIAREILRTGKVTAARAMTIARTEVGRTATAFTAARAEHLGSEGYIWRSAEDSDVRPSHKKLDGKFIRWDSPPSPDGMTGHAGTLPNCRCYPEPVLPEEL